MRLFDFLKYLSPVQKLGAMGVCVLTLFYLATAALTGEGQVDPTLISVFGSMIGIEEARKALKGPDDPPADPVLSPETDPRDSS